MAEADVMAMLLEEWGVPKERILREVESRNTFENATNSLELMRKRGIGRVLLVTDGNLFLEQVLRALPGIEAFRAPPGRIPRK